MSVNGLRSENGSTEKKANSDPDQRSRSWESEQGKPPGTRLDSPFESQSDHINHPNQPRQPDTRHPPFPKRPPEETQGRPHIHRIPQHIKRKPRHPALHEDPEIVSEVGPGESEGVDGGYDEGLAEQEEEGAEGFEEREEEDGVGGLGGEGFVVPVVGDRMSVLCRGVVRRI